LLPESTIAWDARVARYRATALARRTILQRCARQRIFVTDQSSTARTLPLHLRTLYTPHAYQDAAFSAWLREGLCGSVILPTGAGKTCVALRAMAHVGCSTLIIVPTLDLARQWHDVLTEAFGIEVGLFCGGTHECRDITVTTYDSAYLQMPAFGNRFELLIFDEVHHLPAPGYRHIPTMSTALYRLGLTATYARADGAHDELVYLLGPVVYRKTLTELAGEQLADYEIVRLRVGLSGKESEQYAAAEAVYRQYLSDAQLTPHGAGWTAFIKQSTRDPRARAALLAKIEMKRIVVGAERKMELLASLLRRHPGEQVIVFTEYTDQVYRIAAEFLLPPITHETKPPERQWILDAFRHGALNRIVTSKVLNEGVDVPAAKVGIILGGSASPREYVQRLGRLLRKSDDHGMALLYEVVVSATAEVQVSARRRHTHAYA